MANNRLYVVNKRTKEYACIAKSHGETWKFGNADILDEFLDGCNAFNHKEDELIFVKEHGDEVLYDEFISGGTNINKEGRWEYY